MSRLASHQTVVAVYFCNYCSYTHRKKDTVMKHQESCTGEVLEPERLMPKKGSTVKFRNFEQTVEQPFVIYADFESRFKPKNEKRGSSTTQFRSIFQLVTHIILFPELTSQITNSFNTRQRQRKKTLHFTF